MEIKIHSNTFFVFDLDDTLFPEVDFLRSAYRHISARLTDRLGMEVYHDLLNAFQQKRNAFEWLLNTHGHALVDVDMSWLLKEYREHQPSIALAVSSSLFLNKIREMSIPAGLITDGRSITQRNKLRALGIADIFCEIIISEEFGSEKPDTRNFMHFEDKYPGSEFYFFGDNTSKDFIVPAILGWTTICLKDHGSHIHRQDLSRSPLPDYVISSYNEIDFV